MRKKMYGRNLITTALFLFVFLSVLQINLFAEPDVQLSADTKAIKPGEKISLTVRISNPDKEEASIPLPKSYADSIRVETADGPVVQPAKENTSQSQKILEQGEFFGKQFDVTLPKDWSQARKLTVQWELGDLKSNSVEVYFFPDSLARIQIKNFGTVYIDFFHNDAPRTVHHFISLVQKGFYDGLTFHRLIKGFVLQGGDPEGDGTGGRKPVVKPEFNDREHRFGTLSMAHGHKSMDSGTQFFFSLGRQPFLDGKYTTIGTTAGEESDSVLRKVQNQVQTDHKQGEECGKDHLDRPENPVVMETVRMISREQFKKETRKNGGNNSGSGNNK